MKKELYSKDWSINTNRAAKTVILLDMIATIQAKSYSITNRRIPIIIDNKKVWQMIYSNLNILNKNNQDSAVEIVMIQELIDSTILSLPIMDINK